MIINIIVNKTIDTESRSKTIVYKKSNFLANKLVDASKQQDIKANK